MKIFLVLFLATMFAASNAAAQQDPEEEQRCVWRCLANSSGASDPAYGACVERNCFSGRAVSSSGTGAARKDGWAYGDDRQLGRSAHGRTPHGAIGLACGTTGWPLELRIAKELFRGPAVTLMFDDGSALTVQAGAGGVTRQEGAACDLHVSSFKRAPTLYLVDGAIESISGDGSATVITLQGKGKSVATRSAAEAFRAFGGVAVPLTGSSAAIDRMLASCPAARMDVAAGCGD